ncbi:MAG: hypothetical protein RLZZ546_2439, partial [Bacteroidota bacterium]
VNDLTQVSTEVKISADKNYIEDPIIS